MFKVDRMYCPALPLRDRQDLITYVRLNYESPWLAFLTFTHLSTTTAQTIRT